MDTERLPGRFMLPPAPSLQNLIPASGVNDGMSPASYSFEIGSTGFSTNLQEAAIFLGDKCRPEHQNSRVRRSSMGLTGSRNGGSAKARRTKVSRACDACKQTERGHAAREINHVSVADTYTFPVGILPATPGVAYPQYQRLQWLLRDELDDIPSILSRGSIISTQSRQHVDNSNEHSGSGHAAHVSSRNSPVPSTNIGGQYHGPSSPITFLERAWKRIRENHASSISKTLEKEISAEEPLLVTDGNEMRLADERFRMPSKSRTYNLVERYFEIATPFFRFLHKGTVTNLVNTLYQQPSEPHTAHSTISQSQVTLLLMIFAVAASDCGADGSDDSELLLEAAQRRLQRERGAPTLDSVQARLVECLHLLSSRHANEVYWKFGATVALIITLGLHRRKRLGGYRSEIGAIEHECRKRAFWVAYVLDRYLSVMGGRPRTLQDFDADQDFPARVHDDELKFEGIEPRGGHFDCDMDAPIMHIKLARISAQSSAQVYPLRRIGQDERLSQAQRISADLAAWKGELPPFLGMIPASSLIPKFQRQSVTLLLAHAHAAIHANRPFLLNNFATASNPPHLTQQAVRYVHDCVAAARSVVDVLKSFDGNGIAFHSWWFTQYISFCAVAVIYIYTIQQHQKLVSTPAAFASDETGIQSSFLASGKERDWFAMAESCQQRLAAAARENSPGTRYAIVLEELRQETCRRLSTHGSAYGDDSHSVSTGVEQIPLQDGIQDSWTEETTTDFTHMFDDLGAVDWIAHLYHLVGPPSALISSFI
ncbi:hypothetical protein Z517_10089 [Fonsecaea pedrosoi CBS 271.37]|uniref:Xylanolytic transcriptional activator regulatory domain-containing protein n=1 Tax=Fonsecaea pedrosoi CBS 271.37 TaxID=1442368 RepID=A0A0D2G3K7_9EURO|nr:uncharacterized protein Z517_10089 [Fonsecaea pedrosoi CBS 271.37]KIW75348.1 hypothetical protein Z517_10089 [Fonsecaea pedrosoi CBS 271.37]